MTKGMIFDPTAGTLEFKDGARTVIANDGKLVGFLPPGYSHIATLGVSFPDVPKSYAYQWWWTVTGPVVSNWAYDNGCTSAVTATAQEWEDETILATMAGDVDLMSAMVRINRTASPSHTWGGSAIEVRPKQNVWLQCASSVLVEAEIGLARAFSIYLKDNPDPALPPQLALHRQQSVGTSAGGYGSYGNPPIGSFGNRSGGTWYGSGIPVITLNTLDSSPTIDSNSGLHAKETHDIDGPAPCLTSTSSNFASTYQVELIARLGRAS